MNSLQGFSSNRNPVIVTGSDGTVLDYNPTAEIFFGEDVRGQSFLDYMQSPLLFKAHPESYPVTLHDVELKGLSGTVTLSMYQEMDLCILVLENPQLAQEVLLAREEFKWAERLQIMLFGISHELKTPLAVARGYTELIEDPNAVKVMEALDRIAGIINNMTEPLRGMQEDRSVVNLARTIEMYIRTSPYTEPTKRFIGSFEVDVENGDVNIATSKPRLFQILTNLSENAVRATEHLTTEGLISIDIQPCTKPHHHDCVMMTFEDNGTGMTEETAQKVFTPYFTTREPNTGTGLGGYFVYQFVRDAGGSVEVESKLGEGSKFYLHFPIVT